MNVFAQVDPRAGETDPETKIPRVLLVVPQNFGSRPLFEIPFKINPRTVETSAQVPTQRVFLFRTWQPVAMFTFSDKTTQPIISPSHTVGCPLNMTTSSSTTRDNSSHNALELLLALLS